LDFSCLTATNADAALLSTICAEGAFRRLLSSSVVLAQKVELPLVPLFVRSFGLRLMLTDTLEYLLRQQQQQQKQKQKQQQQQHELPLLRATAQRGIPRTRVVSNLVRKIRLLP
jgi:hypothetical protein